MAHGLSCSVACGILPDQDQTRVPCIGRRILNPCATREVPRGVLLMGPFLTLAASELEVGRVSEFKREPWLFGQQSGKRHQQERDWRERAGARQGEGLLFYNLEAWE